MIRHGKVKPKPDIEKFDNTTVYFKDGSKKIFMHYCLYWLCIAHPFFDKSFLNYSSGPVPLYLKMFHPKMDNLFFIGMFQPLGCIWPGAEQQSKLAALAISGEWKRPQNIAQLCEREVTNPHMKQLATSRHTITVDFHKFLRQIKAELRNAKPFKKVA